MAATTRALGSRYRLEEQLGSGAMGTVWRTVEVETGELRAAKLLKSEYTRDPEVVARFVQERSILLGLSHPNIVRVRDLVVDGDDLAIVMDLVEGQDLGAHLRSRGTFAPADAVAIVAVLLDALALAHQQNCLHRDIKPDNVLVSGSDPTSPLALRLSDFGIARLADASTVKATGLLGTPEYMPPELFSDGTFSSASDVYAMGVLLYELLAGRTPFAGGGNAFTIGNRHVSSLPPVLPVDPALWALLSALLHKDPTVRLSADGAARALRDLRPTLASEPALPVQVEPAGWAPATAAAPPPAAPGYVPAIEDIGATKMKVGEIPDTPLPASAGDSDRLTPAAQNLVAGETNVVTRAPDHVAPVLESQAVPAAPGLLTDRSTRLKVIGGSVALLLVVVGVVVALGRGGGDDGPSATGPGGAVPAVPIAFGTYQSGLNISGQASRSGDGVRATFRIESASPLGGKLLIAVPPFAGRRGCPDVTWDRAGGSIDDSVQLRRIAGLGNLCPVSLEGVPLGETPVEVQAAVDPGGAVTDEDLNAWVGEVASATAASLEKIESGSPDFVAQRIEGVVVTTSLGASPAALSTQRVDLVIRPDWVGPDSNAPPFYRTDTEGSTALRHLAGGNRGVIVSPCEWAARRRGSLDTFYFVPKAQGMCEFTVTVGGLTPVQASFEIAY